MKTNMKLAALAVALSAVSASAFAAEGDSSGFYVGGGIGGSNYKMDCSGCSNPDVGFKLFAGYQFSPNFALEGSYLDFGKINYDSGDLHASVKLYSFTAAGVGIVPMGNQAKVFGKLGAHYSTADADAGYRGRSGSGSASKGGLLLGLGFQYDFTKNFSGRLEYEWLNFGSGALDNSNLQLYTANLVYKF
jgi:OOP family OmpA-OmpF porin